MSNRLTLISVTLNMARLLLVCALAVALAWACGGDDDATPTPSTSLSPTPTASVPAATTPAASGGPGIDLATASPMLLAFGAGQGDLPSDQPGLAAGDFNGDGLADLAVGARFADPAGMADAGAAYVVFGSSQPPATVDFREGQQDVTITGPGPGAGLGFSAAAGDLNDDGATDLVLGAPFATIEGAQRGAVYILYGPIQAGESIDLAESAADVTLSGQAATGFFGDSLAIGDVNGDGAADLVIGATFSAKDSSSAQTGAVYLYLGGTSWPGELSAADADSALYASEQADELGDYVSVGDVNGDGLADIIATAEAADGPNDERSIAAEVHILYGREQFQAVYSPGEEDVVIYGGAQNTTLGFCTAAGDLNGDGVADLAMSAHLQAFQNVAGRGVVWVLYGRSDLPREIDTATPPDYMSLVHGTSTADLLSTSCAIADVTGDGKAELVLGGSFVDTRSRPDAGSVYVLDPGRLGATNEVSGGALIERFDGAAAGDRLGGNLAVGDFNGDGKPEIVTVAENAAGPTPDRVQAGRVYVLTP